VIDENVVGRRVLVDHENELGRVDTLEHETNVVTGCEHPLCRSGHIDVDQIDTSLTEDRPERRRWVNLTKARARFAFDGCQLSLERRQQRACVAARPFVADASRRRIAILVRIFARDA
jgi:hypothetical protein